MRERYWVYYKKDVGRVWGTEEGQAYRCHQSGQAGSWGDRDSHERNQCKWIMQLCWPQMGAAERRRRSLSAQTDSWVISYNFCTATRKVILRYDCQDTWGEMILLIPLWHVHFFSSVLWQIAFGVYCTNKWFWPSLLLLWETNFDMTSVLNNGNTFSLLCHYKKEEKHLSFLFLICTHKCNESTMKKG